MNFDHPLKSRIFVLEPNEEEGIEKFIGIKNRSERNY